MLLLELTLEEGMKNNRGSESTLKAELGSTFLLSLEKKFNITFEDVVIEVELEELIDLPWGFRKSGSRPQIWVNSTSFQSGM